MPMLLETVDAESLHEELWRTFHSAWVRASDELAQAEERLAQRAGEPPSPREIALLHLLREHERQSRLLLERVERRAHDHRSRTARYPHRYGHASA